MISAIVEAATGLLDKVIPDADERQRLAHEIASMAERNQQAIDLAQIGVNKIEGQHRSRFVSGWRPSIGWVCSAALAWHFLLQPLLTYILTVSGVDLPPLPTFDMGTLTTVLFGMLGLGGLRTIEKAKGLTR